MKSSTMTVKKIAAYLYIDNVSKNVCELNRTQGYALKLALLQTLKPANKHCYLEVDLDSNDEYAILTCTDEHDKQSELPIDLVSRTNKYIPVIIPEWKVGNIKILLSTLS